MYVDHVTHSTVTVLSFDKTVMNGPKEHFLLYILSAAWKYF